jgi:DNA-binding transcriptional regulator YdaS (Cro superfamily)
MCTNQIEGIRRASDLLGSQLALSKALGVTPVSVSQWLRPKASNGRPVPPKQCVRIEQLTQGQVTRRDLRPDDWQEIWPELVCKQDRQTIESPAEQGVANA